jgi:hypothetical protein
VGDTASRVARVDDGDMPLTAFTHLSVRTIENLISVGILTEIAIADVETARKLPLLQAIAGSQHGTCLRYANIKNGMVLATVFRAPEESPLRQFWMALVGDRCSIGLAVSEACMKSAQCQRAPGQACSCVLVPGVGAGIIAKVSEVISPLSSSEVTRLLDGAIAAEWLRVGRLVAEWCFASGPIAAA